MMNRNLLIAGVIILLLAGAGFFFLSSNSSQNNGTSNDQNGGVITSIKDALSKSMSLECSYEDPERGTTKAYIKNGAVRVDYTASDPKQSGSSIIKDKMMYFWNNEMAFKMAIPEGESTDTTAPQGTSNPNDVLEGIERYKDNCKTAIVSDSLFNVPTDKTFQDFSQMMKGSGNPANGAPNQEQMEDLMKQYGNPQQ